MALMTSTAASTPQADRGDAAGDDVGADGHHALDDVPGDGEVLQPQGAAVQLPAAL
jgi:hypothetical protein